MPVRPMGHRGAGTRQRSGQGVGGEHASMACGPAPDGVSGAAMGARWCTWRSYPPVDRGGSSVNGSPQWLELEVLPNITARRRRRDERQVDKARQTSATCGLSGIMSEERKITRTPPANRLDLFGLRISGLAQPGCNGWIGNHDSHYYGASWISTGANRGISSRATTPGFRLGVLASIQPPPASDWQPYAFASAGQEISEQPRRYGGWYLRWNCGPSESLKVRRPPTLDGIHVSGRRAERRGGHATDSST